MKIRKLLFAVLVLPVALFTAAEKSPYVDLLSRETKALSAEEAARYLTGHGMGLALAAELNGYPGPRHVLELSNDLGLTREQRAEVQAIHDRMHEEAVALGQAVVSREGDLDALFRAGDIGAGELADRLGDIAEIQGRLRYAHLVAHLETTRLLSAPQVASYGRLRGYGEAGGSQEQLHGSGHEGGPEHADCPHQGAGGGAEEAPPGGAEP